MRRSRTPDQTPRLWGMAGMTLVGVFVAVAIVGILATIAVVTYVSYLPHVRLNNSARTLSTDLLLARQLAAKESRTFYAILYPSTEEYKIFRVTAGAPCTDTGSGGTSQGGSSADTTSCDDGNSQDGTGSEQLYLAGTMQAGVDLQTATQAGTAAFNKLYFCSNGLLGLGATCAVTSNSFPLKITLGRTGSSETRLVSVLVSGAVTVK